MGRWRRGRGGKRNHNNKANQQTKNNTQQFKQSDGGSSFADSTSSSNCNNNNYNNINNNNNIWFHWRTREELLRYLQEYREGCWRFYNLTRNQALSQDLELVVPLQLHGDGKDKRFKESNGAARMIGGVEFPPLTRQVFFQPYLALPAALTKLQRRMVHECCLEQDLFHESFEFDAPGTTTTTTTTTTSSTIIAERRIVISIYADGFTSLQKSPAVTFPAHLCKPWFCRRFPTEQDENKQQPAGTVHKNAIHNSGKDAFHVQSYQANAQDQAHQAMDQLMDQPGQCLRDVLDDFELQPNASLADTTPPRLDNDDAKNSSSSSSSSSWMLVDSAAQMQLCADELLQACPTELAFDLEAFNVNKHTQLTCLLQIANGNTGKEYIIDTLAPGVWTHVSLLQPLFANPAIVKIAHSAASLDVRCLHRDFGIFVVNLFDTYEAAQQMQLPSLSLAAVCAHYGLPDCDTYVRLKATHQSGDWRVRPLTSGMILYGRYDVHYLVQLRQLMIRDMVLRQRQYGETDCIVGHSLAQTLAQIAQAEQDAITDESDDGVDDVKDDEENIQTPTKSVDSDGLAFLEAEENDKDEKDVDAENGLMADSDEDSAFKTAVGMSRFEDGSFYTARRFHSRAASIMTLDDSFLDAREDLSPVKNYPSKISAAELRLQPILMSVISTSQERCRNLWKADREPHRNNALFQSILKRAKYNQAVQWEATSTDLFDLLAAWREDVAEQLECLPGFVAPLDFLVAVAWKRPTTEHGLRRINLRLPPVLDQFPEYRQQLLDRVLEFTLNDGGLSPTATVAFYSNLNLPAEFGDAIQSRGFAASSVNLLTWDTALKVVVAGILCEGFIRVVMDVRRKQR